MNIQNKFIIKLILGVLAFLAVYFIALMIFSKYGISREDIRNFVIGLGSLGVVAIIILMALSVMSPFPDSPTAIIAVVIYGPILGPIFILCGSMLGAVLDFIIARKLGRKFISKRWPDLISIINKFAKRFGFESMVFFRIFPTVTFDIVSYTAALTHVKFKTFCLATFLGLLPLTITYGIVGTGLESDDGRKIVLSLILGLGLISVVILMSKYFGDKLQLNALEDESIY